MLLFDFSDSLIRSPKLALPQKNIDWRVQVRIQLDVTAMDQHPTQTCDKRTNAIEIMTFEI